MDTSNTLLEVTFNPMAPDGHIFFAGNVSNAVDFLSLSLVDRRVELDFNLGSGPLPDPLRSSPLQLNVWHTIFVSRTLRSAAMIVDGIQYGPSMSTGGLTQLNIQSLASIGGPRDPNILPPGSGQINFQGCIGSLVVSKKITCLGKIDPFKLSF